MREAIRDKENYKHKYCNIIVNVDFDVQYCIIGIDSLIKNVVPQRPVPVMYIFSISILYVCNIFIN